MALFGFYRQVSGDLPLAESGQLAAAAGAGLRDDRRARPGLPSAPGVLVGLRGPDRRRGDQQRRAGLQEAQEQERRHHPAAHGLDRGDDAPVDDGAVALDRRQDRRGTPRPSSPSTACRSASPTCRTPSWARCPRRCSTASRSGWCSSPSSPASSSCSRRTPPSTASRCSARSSPATASSRASCTPAATGSRSPTASSSSRPRPPALIVIYNAEVTRLIQLYIVGVFVSFTLTQIGMVRHWTRHFWPRAQPAGARPHGAQPGHQRRRCGDVRHRARRRPR